MPKGKKLSNDDKLKLLMNSVSQESGGSSKKKLLVQREQIQNNLKSLMQQVKLLDENYRDTEEGLLRLFNIDPKMLSEGLYRKVIQEIQQVSSTIQEALTSEGKLVVCKSGIKKKRSKETAFEISEDIKLYEILLNKLKNVAATFILNEVKDELKGITLKINNLKTNYLKEKSGTSHLLNAYGWFSKSIPNHSRLASINEVQRVSKSISLLITDEGNIDVSKISNKPLLLSTNTQISQFKVFIEQLNGAILSVCSEIGGSHSVLLRLLKETLSADLVDETQALTSYHSFLLTSPRPILSAQDDYELISVPGDDVILANVP